MTESFWVLFHTNSQQFIGRYGMHWTHSYEIEGARLFSSCVSAENGRQALLQEAKNRIEGKHPPGQWWFDIYGGVVEVREVERILRVKDTNA